ncbi:DUF748 domain-containing protein [candidate division WWE3 bacterium]|nr:DUF748 domain-containing protein [candidate division WWE3 bacterium]
MKVVSIFENEKDCSKSLVVKEDTVFVIPSFLESVSDTEKWKLELNLEEEGVRASVIYAGYVKKALDLSVETIHGAPNTKSNVQIRAVMEKGAKAKFSGNVHAKVKAKNAEGEVNIKGLAAGEGISWEVKPNLEVENENVKLDHKASLTSFNERQLMYLRSRGFEKAEASVMLQDGFLAEAVETILKDRQDQDLKRAIIEKIKR